MRGEVEQILFLFARGGQSLKVGSIDDDMTGRTGHHALASALEWLARRPGDVEQALAGSSLNFPVEGSVSLEETHQGHASSFS